MKTSEFNLIKWQEALIVKLIGLLKMGRKGRKAYSLALGTAKKQLKKLGYSEDNAFEIVVDCRDMVSLQLSL